MEVVIGEEDRGTVMDVMETELSGIFSPIDGL